MENFISGGYTSFRAFDDDERIIFESAEGKPKGVSFVPLAVATQIISGTKKYAFLCGSGPLVPDAEIMSNELITIMLPEEEEEEEKKKPPTVIDRYTVDISRFITS